jgi:hypothetical protein
LAQDRKNLGVAISRHLHQNLLRYLAEKILLPHPLSFGEDYPIGTQNGFASTDVSYFRPFRLLRFLVNSH